MRYHKCTNKTTTTTQTINKTPITQANKKTSESLRTTGKPNSEQTIRNPDGTIKQRRFYGPDGKALKDIDYNHGGVGHRFPHQHKWSWDTGKGVRRKS